MKIAASMSVGRLAPKHSLNIDGMSSVTKQVKKNKNRHKIRDSERFAEIGSLPESLFSCFDNSVIVCLLIG